MSNTLAKNRFFRHAFYLAITGVIFNTNAFANNCIQAASSVTAVIFDISDPLSTPANLAFDSVIKRLVDEVEEGGRLDVYFIKDGIEVTGNPTGFFCKPERPLGGGGELSFNKRLKVQFVNPAISTLNRGKEAGTSSKTSPILESIFNVGLKSFSKTNTHKTHWGKIVVISDLLQNSNIASFYRLIPQYKDLSNQKEFTAWSRPIEKVGLELIMLSSHAQSSKQGKELIQFWSAYGSENFCNVRLIPISQAMKGWKVDGC